MLGIYAALENGKRDHDGSEYVYFGESSLEWMRKMAQAAHGEMLPDDHRYRFIREALAALSDNENTDDARNSLEADIFTRDLLNWLASRIDRIDYCDTAVDDYGANSDTLTRISIGQWVEKMEVFDLIVEFLECQVNQ